MNKCRMIARGLLVALAGCYAYGAASQSVTDYDARPPLLTSSATPLVMLAMSNDHQLYYKAFTDYDDLDGDGDIETTYTHSFDYVGYFDPYKCYTYNTTHDRFTPVVVNTDKYCSETAKVQWSGNFLNWATMTRMDQVRKVLYGGHRVVDTAEVTVLQRALLPNDAHSFAKYYNGTDLARLTPFGNQTSGVANSKDSGITICNTTRSDNGTLSQAVTKPPLARVVKGNYSLWAANERYQCLMHEEADRTNDNVPATTGIYAYSSNPKSGARIKEWGGRGIYDYDVKVEACGSNPTAGREDCKQYPDGNYKPIGILQRFGDNDSIHFGLLTGSYRKNKSGGILRKNIGSVTNEINVTTNGTFKATPASGAIIGTIDRLRIANYRYHTGNGNNDGTYNGNDSCSWGRNSFSNNQCTNWGNPLAEIMLECYRYFAGKTPNTNFWGDDSTLISGLPGLQAWANPQTEDTACAKLNLIAFNASTVSYDGDELGGMTDLNGTLTAQQRTAQVGSGEGIHNSYSFVGKSGGSTNQLCTAKQITDLGTVSGTCPDAPRLEGTYNSAGIAYHANITDLRTDLSDNQTVRTYGVTLAPAVPQVVLTTASGRRVSILPACYNQTIGGACGLVDFKIVQQYIQNGTRYGQFYVNWEDSEQGGDYDQDMSGIVSYELTNTTIKITTRIFGKSTTDRIGFGYVLSGSVTDGFHAHSGIEGFTGNGCNNCRHTDAASTKTYNLGVTSEGDSVVQGLQQPLFYAAKWGGFVDKDGDGKPSSPAEWDQVNNVTGAISADGQPDTFFWAINPDTLRAQLSSILINILERTASGTSAAVVSNTGTGDGALYQALYTPRFSPGDNVDAISWVGSLNGLFLDRYGYIREDNAAPYRQLTDDDNIVDIYYDETSQKTLIQRYEIEDDGTWGATVGAPELVQEIKPIWSAVEQLSKVSNYTAQRASYNDPALQGRYLLTALDTDGDGQINSSTTEETLAFTAANFTGNNQRFRLLGLKTATKARAGDLVNWVRGAPISGYRNRYIDLDGDGDRDPVLLGDIIHSSPVAVHRPQEGYDLAFNDTTYRTFRQTYANRRQMVYIGANDGMLHAFNGGFFDPTASKYLLTVDGKTSHPLGAEMWGYVPYNLLPHLQWLASPDYPHVYYMDGGIKVFDVNIFTPSTTHPGGWGTILVATMRFGGGEYTLDPNSDPDGNANDDMTLRSAVVVLDVTDPEKPPKVLAEITHADLGYTTVEPALVKMREPDATGSYATPATNEWYLVFGSGPRGNSDATRADALDKAVSSRPARLFIYDLKKKTLAAQNVGVNSSFVGGIESIDWNRDYSDDALYFGTVTGTSSDPNGRLFRAVVKDTVAGMELTVSQALDITNRAFSSTPKAVRDPSGEMWVYTGTGRFFVTEDNYSTEGQYFLGFKEPHNNGVLPNNQVARNDLIDTTNIAVFTDGTVARKTGTGPINLPGLSGPATTFDDVVKAVAANAGWRFDFTRTRARSLSSPVVSGQSLVFTEYQPSGLKCTPEGQGYMHAPHLRAGIPGVFKPLGVVSNAPGTPEATPAQIAGDIALGVGAPSAPVLHQGLTGVSAIVQSSTGEIKTTSINGGDTPGGRQSWRELMIDWNY